ncbi:unnamed protein product [Schistosoma rodhaini]|uniref:Kinetochore protein SPC25 n=1 Tax=Schistosoma mansoni TaxID=6183 RepID=G4V9L1_SCHMA|nr:hypothetical protein Smp_091480 [Schistosoma mansoni]CAH8485504.1 unnamed protein product [Schistosoma rodhaini]|eukprot:XP_018649177.1 hypothetical protein Smp_091480 [Schistosoma mansoni]
MSDVFRDEFNTDTSNIYLKTTALIQQILSATHEEEQELKLSGDRAAQLREVNNKLRERLINDEKRVDCMISRLQTIKRTIKELRASIEKFKSIKIAYLKQIESENPPEDSFFPCEFENSTLMQIYKMIQPFERVLGIQIQKTHSGLLQLLFHGCSEALVNSDEVIVCCCQLRIVNTNRFEVVLCDPPVPDLERLVKHLNWTEDIRSFIIVLRQRFCRYFELAAAVSNKLSSE